MMKMIRHPVVAACRPALLAWAGSLLIGPALAAPTADPTRPPAGWITAQQGANPVVTSETADEPADGLRVLRIGPSKRLAVVDGQVVGPGDKLGESKVLAIRPDAVVVEDKEGNTALKLAPAVEKKLISATSQHKPTKAKRSNSRKTISVNGNGVEQ